MKKRLLSLLLILCLALSFVLAACAKGDKKAQAALDELTIDQDGKSVGTAFNLPKNAGDYELTWSASPASSLTLTKSENAWNAVPVRGSSDVAVTITATITTKKGSLTKDFHITVPKAEGGPAQDALNRYILEQEGAQVTAEFTLPKTIGTFAVTWTSNNTDALTITERADDYLATPHRLDDTVSVTLTVRSGAAIREFITIVPGFGVSEIASAFGFSKNGITVGSDFELPESTTQGGKTATIAWTVASGSDYIKVENGKCVLIKENITDVHDVSLKATFSYGGKTANKTYNFKVANVEDHYVAMHKWYTSEKNDASNISLEGYVTVFASDFGSGSSRNVTFYMVDMEGCHSVYSYQTKMADTSALVRAGSHILVTGGTIDVYNGLYELKGATMTLIDNDRENMESSIYAVDEDIIGGLDSTKYHTGSLVSLTNWKVDSVNVKEQSAFGTKDYAGSVMTLSKGGVTIDVAYNNYMEGVYRTATGTNSSTRKYDPDDRFLALYNDGFKAVQANTYISVTGILSMNDGKWQILPRSASDLKTGVQEAASGKGAAAKTAVDALKTAIGDKLDSLLTESLTLDLPVDVSGVKINYRICVDSPKSVAIARTSEKATLTVTPDSVEEIVWVEAIISSGDFVTYHYFKIASQSLDDAAIVAKVLADIDSELQTSFTKAATIPLPTETPFDGVKVEWTVVNAPVAWLDIDAQNNLVVTIPSADDTAKINVKVTLREESDNKDITISVTALDLSQFGTLDNPLTVAEARAIANGLSSGEYTTADYLYYVKGVVSRVTYPGDLTKSWTFFMTDEGGTDELQGYYVYTDTADMFPDPNDVVVVNGRLTKYNSTLEIATQSGSDVKAKIVKNEKGNSTISLGKHDGATVTGFESGNVVAKNGTTFSFTVTADSGLKITSVKYGSKPAAKGTDNNYSFTVAGDAEVTVVTEPDVPANYIARFTFGDDSGKSGSGQHKDGNTKYAANDTVTYGDYTLTFKTATNAYKDALDDVGQGCMKLGTASGVASFTFDVDSSVNFVTFYIAGYKDKDGKVKINGQTYTITAHSNDGDYAAIVVDVSATHTISFETISGTTRAMIQAIEWSATGTATAPDAAA